MWMLPAGGVHDKNEVRAERIASDAILAASEFRKILYGKDSQNQVLIGAALDVNSAGGDSALQFFISRTGNTNNLEKVSTVVCEDQPKKEVWQRGCIIRCELPLKLPLYYAPNNPKGIEDAYARAIEDVERKFRDPQATYIIEPQPSLGGPQSVILHGTDLDLPASLPTNAFLIEDAQESIAKSLTCSYFLSDSKDVASFTSLEKNADKIVVSVMFNRSRSNSEPAAPIAEYYPAMGEAQFLAVNHKLEVLSYAKKDLLLTSMVSKLLIPGLVDQLHALKNKFLADVSVQQPQLQPYHFMPTGFLHPITVVYELSYGETEIKQVEARRTLHRRLGLPLDRPLLRIANAINFSTVMDKSNSKGSSLLKDVHLGIPNSGVSGGHISLIQGSYEYYHYLQDGFDDSIHIPAGCKRAF
ncbi:Probable Ufm1-specific protease [Striga hermonthica]|uniref:Probable Ufm1-specific protease n=1 Tax=Striga hermonthica TaxID=68872 RepID=A0A9N7MK77_STRHE|nr:Probable Ufm1-specific protease [Striga hermonthica]